MEINMLALQDGLVVLCVGFSVVFAFLTVMIFAMHIMSKVVSYLNKIFPVQTLAPQVSKSQAGSMDDEIAVAIACVFKKMH